MVFGGLCTAGVVNWCFCCLAPQAGSHRDSSRRRRGALGVGEETQFLGKTFNSPVHEQYLCCFAIHPLATCKKGSPCSGRAFLVPLYSNRGDKNRWKASLENGAAYHKCFFCFLHQAGQGIISHAFSFFFTISCPELKRTNKLRPTVESITNSFSQNFVVVHLSPSLCCCLCHCFQSQIQFSSASAAIDSSSADGHMLLLWAAWLCPLYDECLRDYLATGMASNSMMNAYGSMEMQTYGSTYDYLPLTALIDNQVCPLVMLLVYFVCK
jgi:hypothetical protein